LFASKTFVTKQKEIRVKKKLSKNQERKGNGKAAKNLKRKK
jgi:hypothetical protein